MKNVLCFLFFLMTITFVSCDTKDKTTSDETYLLKMRLNKGDKFGQDMSMNMDMMMMKMNMDMGMDFEVVDSTPAGKQLKITYSKMDMKMDMGGMGGANMDSVMNKANQKLIGKSVFITLEGNKVIDVKGFEAFTEADADENEKEMVKKMLSKENINSMFGMLFNMYPDTEVKVGDTWKKVNTIDVSGMAMEVNTEYKLNSVKDGIAELGLTGTIGSNGNPVPGTDSSMQMKMDMKGTQTGKMYVKVSDGYIKEGNYDLDLDMNMGINEQSMPMKMKATYIIKGR